MWSVIMIGCVLWKFSDESSPIYLIMEKSPRSSLFMEKAPHLEEIIWFWDLPLSQTESFNTPKMLRLQNHTGQITQIHLFPTQKKLSWPDMLVVIMLASAFKKNTSSSKYSKQFNWSMKLLGSTMFTINN